MAAFLAGQHSSFYPNAPAGLQFYGDPGIPKSYANGNWGGFAPRVGLAWDPSGKGAQSIRTSYGIFFDAPETFTARDLGASAPWGYNVSLTAPAGGLTNPYFGYPGGNPFPTLIPPTSSATFPAAGQYINFPLNLHHMYHQQWDLSYQRQLGPNWLLTAAYLGSKATHLRTSVEANPAVYSPDSSTVANTQQRRLLTILNSTQGAFYSNITQADDGVNANYNGLRVSAQHRFAMHFTVLSVLYLVALHAKRRNLRKPQQHRVGAISKSLRPQWRHGTLRFRPAPQLVELACVCDAAPGRPHRECDPG